MNDDTISRQAAIDALHMHLMYRMGTDSNKKRLDEWINNLPPAEPKRGRWIYKTDLITAPTGYWECSECKEGRLLYEANFCPNCGADMRGERDERTD